MEQIAKRLEEAERAFRAYSSNYSMNRAGDWIISESDSMRRPWSCNGADVLFCVEFEPKTNILNDMYRIDRHTGERIDLKYPVGTKKKPDFCFKYNPIFDLEPDIPGEGKAASLLELIYSHYKRSVRANLVGEYTHDYLMHFSSKQPIEFDRKFQFYFPKIQFFPEVQPSLAEMIDSHFLQGSDQDGASHRTYLYIARIKQLEKRLLANELSQPYAPTMG